MHTAIKLNNINPYQGPAMNQKIAILRKEGKDVINLGLGDPDTVPPQHILKALVSSAADTRCHHYPSAYPLKPLYEAIASWYKRRHEVDLNPDTEIVYCLGAAEGIFQLPNCLLDPGETALVPDPAYPSYEAAVKIAGGQVSYYPLKAENNFLPDLASIKLSTKSRAKMIWINYPNNPTAATANLEFFEKLASWARENDIAVVSDNPYMDVFLGGAKPPSFLNAAGAKDVGVELGSMSKSFNCCGMRVGMLVGNNRIIEAMKKVKSHADRGLYYPLQKAAIAALTGPVDWMEGRNRVFAERRDIVVRAWRQMGLDMAKPVATFYCWGKIPEGHRSTDFCMKLLEAEGVWMIPGST